MIKDLFFLQPVGLAKGRYTEVCTSRLDVARAIAGKKACWVDTETEYERKPKTLIIADWSLGQKESRVIKSIFSSLFKLHGGIHPIYVWQASRNKLVPVSSLVELAELDFSSVTPVTASFLEDNLEALGVTAPLESIFILDYVSLNALLKIINYGGVSSFDQMRDSLSLGLKTFVKSQHPKDRILSALKGNTFTLQIPWSALRENIALINQASQLIVTGSCPVSQEEVAPSHQFEWLINQTAILSKIINIEIDAEHEMNHVDGGLLIALLNAMKNLKVLNWKVNNNSKKLFFQAGLLTGESLEEVILESVAFERDEASESSDLFDLPLADFLLDTPNLRLLSLIKISLIRGVKRLREGVLPNLEEIILIESEFDDEPFRGLLRAAPNLKELFLSECNFSEEIFENFSQQHLSHLEAFRLIQCSVHSKFLVNLCQAAPNLKRMEFEDCTKLTEAPWDLELEVLPCLEALIFIGCMLGMQVLQAFCKVAPNLKSLSTNVDENFDEKNWLRNLSEPLQVENVTFSEVSIDEEFLKLLSEKMPKLKSLEVNEIYCDNEESWFVDSKVPVMQTLEEIILSTFEESEWVPVLFKMAPNLKELCLGSEVDSSVLVEEALSVLPKLKCVKFYFNRISSALLVALSTITPNLMEIEVDTEVALSHLVNNKKLFQLFPRLAVINSNGKNVPFVAFKTLVSSMFKAEPSPLKGVGLGYALSSTCISLCQQDMQEAYNLIENKDEKAFLEKFGDYLNLKEERLSQANSASSLPSQNRGALPNFPNDLGIASQVTEFKLPRTPLVCLMPREGGIAPPIDPREYRGVRYQLIEAGGFFRQSWGTAVEIKLENESGFFSEEIFLEKGYRYYDGRLKNQLSQGGRLTLIGYTVADTIENIRVYAGGRLLTRADVRVWCDRARGHYWVENISRVPLEIIVEYVLKTPETPEDYEVKQMDLESEPNLAWLTELVNHCRTFTIATPAQEQELNGLMTQQAKLEYLYANKVGACGHRSQVLAYKVHEGLEGREEKQAGVADFQVEIVINEIHAYVEIFFQGAWKKIDLGGYPVAIPHYDYSLCVKREPAWELSDRPIHPVKTPDQREVETAWVKVMQAKTHISERGLKEAVAMALQETKGETPYRQNRALYCEQKQVACILKAVYQQETQPIFYIHSSEQMQRIQDRLELKEEKGGEFRGRIKTGALSALGEWLNQAKLYTSPVIIINWHAFSNQELVRGHSIIDGHGVEPGNIEGYAIPPQVKIISLIERRRAETRSDFLGRHEIQVATHSSLATQVDQAVLAEEKEAKASFSEFELRVDLDTPDWYECLVGCWEPGPDGFRFDSGPLLNAIHSSCHLVLENMPSDNPEFIHFWENLIKTKTLVVGGKAFALPHNFNWTSCRINNWPRYQRGIISIKTGVTTSAGYFHLNSMTLEAFIKSYQVEADGRLRHAPGYLALHQGCVLRCFVTHTLSRGEWQRILRHAEQFAVKLSLLLAPGVSLPNELTTAQRESKEVKVDTRRREVGSVAQLPAVTVHLTNPGREAIEQEVAVQQNSLIQVSPHPLHVIEFTKLNAADLLYVMNLKKAPRERQALFFEEKCTDPLAALKKGKTVILKGKLSKELAQSLSMLFSQGKVWHNNQWETITGALHVVTDEARYLHFLPECCLQKSFTVEQPPALATVRSQRPTGFSPLEVKQETKTDLMTQRLTRVNNALRTSPTGVVAICGVTAAGKSTFVTKVMPQQCGHEVIDYRGDDEDALHDWVTRVPLVNQYALLFVDEANLALLHNLEKFFDCEYGTILIAGKVYNLTPSHKVVLAYNPSDYGGGRVEHPLIQRATKITFEALPESFLLDKVLLPLKPVEMQDASWRTICHTFLTLHRFIAELKDKAFFVTARELEAMALSVQGEITSDDAKKIAWQFSRYLMSSPPRQRLIARKFGLQEESRLVTDEVRTQFLAQGYYLGNSRVNLYQSIQSLLTLRTQKCVRHASVPALGGMMLFGEPGVGKSSFIKAALKVNGFTEGGLNALLNGTLDERMCHQQYFYLASEVGFVKKQRMVEQAYKYGVVLIIDELDTMNPEVLLKPYLGNQKTAGKTLHPGTLILGTGNGAKHRGREKLSPAMLHCLIHEEMQEMPYEELLAWCEKLHPALDFLRREALCQLYTQQKKATALRGYSQGGPQATFREFMQMVSLLERRPWCGVQGPGLFDASGEEKGGSEPPPKKLRVSAFFSDAKPVQMGEDEWACALRLPESPSRQAGGTFDWLREEDGPAPMEENPSPAPPS